MKKSDLEKMLFSVSPKDKKRINNDLKKVNKCEEKGIRLIRVYDGCGKEIQKGNDVFSFSKSIALDLSDSIETVKHSV